ncbi:hypothetical protein C8J57DRAFT_1465842 [Mycena rebaudengoi]|nr:hypothetical protein C8J57DRAFT_1465842 [Mycena rebaudengoi]
MPEWRDIQKNLGGGLEARGRSKRDKEHRNAARPVRSPGCGTSPSRGEAMSCAVLGSGLDVVEYLYEWHEQREKKRERLSTGRMESFNSACRGEDDAQKVFDEWDALGSQGWPAGPVDDVHAKLQEGCCATSAVRTGVVVTVESKEHLLDAEVDLVIQLSKLSQRHSGVSRDLPATPTPPHPDAITPNYVLAVVKTALTCPYIYSVQNANVKYLVRFVVVVLSTLRIGTSTSSV